MDVREMVILFCPRRMGNEKGGGNGLGTNHGPTIWVEERNGKSWREKKKRLGRALKGEER